MDQLELDNVVPQTLVFAQLPGLPWWPAVVGRCPATGVWKDREQRRWVFFFGGRYGAWLQLGDMRPYDEETKASIPETNALSSRYRPYEARVMTAGRLADEFQETKGTGRPTGEYCRCLTGIAIGMPELPRWGPDGPHAKTKEVGSTGENNKSERKPAAARHSKREKAAPEAPAPAADDSHPTSVALRPRRKRVKSIRTMDLEEVPEGRRKTQGRKGSSDESPTEDGDSDVDSPTKKPKGPTGAPARISAADNRSASVDEDNPLLVRISKQGPQSSASPPDGRRRKSPARNRQQSGPTPPRAPPKGIVWKHRKGGRPKRLPMAASHGKMRLEEARAREARWNAASGFPVRKNPMFRAQAPVAMPTDGDASDASDATMSDDDIGRIVGYAPTRARVPPEVAASSVDKWLRREIGVAQEVGGKGPDAQTRVLVRVEKKMEAMDVKMCEVSKVMGARAPTEGTDPVARRFKDTVEGLLREAEEFVVIHGGDEAKMKRAIEMLAMKREGRGMAHAWAAWEMAVWEIFRQRSLSLQSDEDLKE